MMNKNETLPKQSFVSFKRKLATVEVETICKGTDFVILLIFQKCEIA